MNTVILKPEVTVTKHYVCLYTVYIAPSPPQIVANVIVGVLFIHTDTIYERKHVCRPKINHQEVCCNTPVAGFRLVQGSGTAQHRKSHSDQKI